MKQIQLIWNDVYTNQQRTPTLNIPIAIGRVFDQMPSEVEGKRVSRIALNDNQISRYHALIDWQENNLIVIDQGSINGTFVNGVHQSRSVLNDGDKLRIGHYVITIIFISNTPPVSSNSVIQFNPQTGLPDPQIPAPPQNQEFPPPTFHQGEQVSLASLQQSGFFNQQYDQFDYATIGAGLGSYIWVDYLRIFGVKPSQIVALGIQPQPYAKYQQLCLNSQIPLHERLRSNSDSCPDNIWGWPSYALREAWHDLKQGKIEQAGRYLWQVFAEPTFVETYTPRANNVFDSIDREAKRIGWSEIFRYGSVRAIRKTDDGRYAIAYSRGGGKYAIVVAKYLHLATGYPAIRFLPHLQAYREQTQDVKAVVNAYEAHDHIYKQLGKQGGVVLVQGRGIVASRILQKIYEVIGQTKETIEVIHLMRSPISNSNGHKFGWAKRAVKHNWEFQPFNWPKACWGGELREVLEQADPQQRLQLIKDWGGTTTADRQDWQTIIETGLKERWYRIEFGTVQQVEPENQRIKVTYTETNQRPVLREVDFIIDATGLDADVRSSPLLKDLIEHYNLPLLSLGKQPGVNDRISVANDFEIVEMRSSHSNQDTSPGRIYAAGAMTLGGPYAAVDSFLGLQYAALWSINSLIAAKAPRLQNLTPWQSGQQWYKWVSNQAP